MPGPTDMNDLINDAPDDLLDEENTGEDENTEDQNEDEEDFTATGDQTQEDEEDDADGDSDEEDESEDSDDESTDDSESESEEDEEDDNEDYITKTDLEEEDKPDTNPADPVAPTTPDEAEAKWVLDQLQPITVRIINAKDEVETVKVYGYGDLPQDYKGFPSKYEEGIFNSAATAQGLKARELQAQYKNSQAQKTAQEWERKENLGIAQDLKDLREEGIFPKFRGRPGTKEFANSQGAQVFDEVIAYMNEQNQKFAEDAQKGRPYYHMNFKQAFNDLYPGLRQSLASEDKARRGVARKLKSTQGTEATKSKNRPAQVLNMNDLEDEFAQFAGAA